VTDRHAQEDDRTARPDLRSVTNEPGRSHFVSRARTVGGYPTHG
jgi:hypothetical protein